MRTGKSERQETKTPIRFTFYAFRFCLWLTAVFLFWFVLRTVSLAETWALLRGLGGWQLALLMLANGSVLLLMNGRWWLILRGQGYVIPYLTLAAYRLAGAGLSYVTPGPQFGGEPLQVLLIEQNYAMPRTTAVAAITLDKTLELIVNFSFLVGGIFVVWQTRLLGNVAGWQTAVFPLLLLTIPFIFLLSFWQDWRLLTRCLQLPLHWLRSQKWAHPLQKLQQGLATSEKQLHHLCRQHPRTLLLAFLISCLGWTALMAEFWLMLTLLGLPVTLMEMIVILTAARVAILLPLPGGVGTLEASQLLAFTAFGFAPAAAISFSLLIHARDVALACLGLWFARASVKTVLPS